MNMIGLNDRPELRSLETERRRWNRAVRERCAFHPNHPKSVRRGTREDLIPPHVRCERPAQRRPVVLVDRAPERDEECINVERATGLQNSLSGPAYGASLTQSFHPGRGRCRSFGLAGEEKESIFQSLRIDLGLTKFSLKRSNFQTLSRDSFPKFRPKPQLFSIHSPSIRERKTAFKQMENFYLPLYTMIYKGRATWKTNTRST